MFFCVLPCGYPASDIRFPLLEKVLAEFDEVGLSGVKITVMHRDQIVRMELIVVLDVDLLQAPVFQLSCNTALIQKRDADILQQQLLYDRQAVADLDAVGKAHSRDLVIAEYGL